MDYMERYKQWCEDGYYDESAKKELLRLQGQECEIEERFYKELDFGTGGLRGIMGAGTNRMNIYTVRKATQGLANYIIAEKASEKGVVIAYDSRNHSAEFAREAALCLAANGIKAYVFDSLRPTPELSFAVRELKCVAGIVITASHNPPEYNGYKVYWGDGAQITAPIDGEIIRQIRLITDVSMIKTLSKEIAISNQLYISIGESLDEKFLSAIIRLTLCPEVIRQAADRLKIVYTPLHGSGGMLVQKGLTELGYKQVYAVKEQEQPDGDFPTIKSPNPEEEEAFTLALQLAKEVNADIILATDPDADRLGLYAKDKTTGKYIRFTGNMTGILMAEYILRNKKEKGTIPAVGSIVTTIVTTKMADAVTREYKVNLAETLTGFKYIGEQIRLFEQEGDQEFIFGFEESCGYLTGTYARDKDAVGAAIMLCEIAAFCKVQNRTLWDEMVRLYQKYGYFREELCTITLNGQEGNEKIKAIMSTLRTEKPNSFGNFAVLEVYDYKNGEVIFQKTGNKQNLDYPKSNVMYFKLSNDSWCCVRPSGTEPKIKIYMGVKGHSLDDSEKKLDELRESVMDSMQTE